MSSWAEKRAALPPIDLSSIVFEDEEDEYECSSSTSPSSTSVSSSLVSSPTSSAPTSVPSTSSPLPTEPPVRKVLEPTDRNTDFFWPMGIRPFELRCNSGLLQCFVPNNNDIDLIINGPKGQVTPVTRPPNTSPKWGWKPRPTIMRQVTTIVHKLAPTNRSTDFLWPRGIRPLELRGPTPLVQAVIPNNNGIYEIVNGPKSQVVPVITRLPIKSRRWGWEPSLTMMRHVTTIVHKLEPANRSTDFLWPRGIRPLELRGPPQLLQAAVPDNNGIYETVNGPKSQVVPVVTRPPNKFAKRDWEPTLTMMRHVWTMEEEKGGEEEEEEEEEILLPPRSSMIESGNGTRLFIGVLGFLALVGLWFLA